VVALHQSFESYISALVFQEAGRGDAAQARQRLKALKAFPILEVDEDARILAQKIIDGKGIPGEYPEDALHVAVAAINGVDILATWNFSHLNNPFTRMMIRQIVENHDCNCPEICSPEELLEAKS